MSIAIDLALIIFIIISISLASSRGFVYSLITLVGYIAAAILGFSISGTVAQYVTDSFLRESIIDKISTELAADSIEGIVSAVSNALPDFLLNLLNLSESMISEYVGQGSRTIAEGIYDNAIAPIVLGIVKTIFAILVLTVLFFIVRRIARFAKSVIRHTFLSSVDKIFGGVLGFAKSIVIIICTMFVIKFALMIGSGQIGPFGLEDIDNSLLFKFFYRGLLGL